MAKLMPLPLTVSCFSKIQIDFTFLVPAHPGSPGKTAFKRVCVCVCVCIHAGSCWSRDGAAAVGATAAGGTKMKVSTSTLNPLIASAARRPRTNETSICQRRVASRCVDTAPTVRQ